MPNFLSLLAESLREAFPARRVSSPFDLNQQVLDEIYGRRILWPSQQQEEHKKARAIAEGWRDRGK